MRQETISADVMLGGKTLGTERIQKDRAQVYIMFKYPDNDRLYLEDEKGLRYKRLMSGRTDIIQFKRI